MADDVKRHLEQIDKKLDKMDQRLDRIDVTLMAQHKSLEHHIYRTSLAEDRIEKIEEENKETLKSVDARVKPIEAHVHRVDGALKFIGGLSVAVALVTAIIKLIDLL